MYFRHFYSKYRGHHIRLRGKKQLCVLKLKHKVSKKLPLAYGRKYATLACMPIHTAVATPSINWFANPDPNHLVHFYPFDDVLLVSLADYIASGLEAGDTCIAIATSAHLIELNAALREKGIDVGRAIDNDQYLMCDADTTLSEFMADDLPDHTKFMNCIGRIISLAGGRGKPIRAFGEMVAILWESGNLEGLLQLEKYWHGLVTDKSFSLYCAYPDALFSSSPQHQNVINKICNCHSVAVGVAI